MNKDEALRVLRKAKSAHLEWRSYAQSVVSGVENNQVKAPLDHTECEFGHWYNGLGKSMFSHLDSFDAIKVPHQMLHDIYKKIFEVIQYDESGGITDLFKSRAKIESEKLELANQHMKNLISASETLLLAIDMLEKEITSQPD